MRPRDLITLSSYLVLALMMTLPLALNFSTRVPGTEIWAMDEYGYVWNNWWFKHALFDLQTNPFQTNYLLYPIGASLVLYTYTLLHVLLGLPLQFAFGLIPSVNAQLLFSFVVAGYGAFLLSQYLLRNNFKSQNPKRETWSLGFAAWLAGALFAFSSNRFVYASLGHYNVVGSEWLPFYVLFLIKTVRDNKPRDALLAGFFAALAMYVETTAGVLLLLFTILYLLLNWRRAIERATLRALALVAASAAIFFAPLLIPTVGEILNSGYTLPGWGHAEKLAADLFSFFAPTSLHPLARGWEQELDRVRQGNARFADVNTVFLGYLTLALAAFAAFRFWKTLKTWAISAISFAVLSLGPLLHIGGQSQFDLDGLAVNFPLPFLLLHYIPLIKENRVPNRFSILVMLALAVLVSFAAVWLMQKFKTRSALIAGALAFGLLFEHAALPLPLTDARVPDVYAQIAREPGDFAILTLPLGFRNSFGGIGAEDTRAQYYQSVHQKFAFPANVQRNAPILFDYFDRLSLFHSLTEIELYRDVSPETRARDQRDAPALMAFFDIRYLVVNAAPANRVPFADTRAATLEYARAVLPLGEKIYDRDGVVAYHVNQAAVPSAQRIDFGTDAALLYQADGWDRAELIADARANWANRKSARVFFPIREIADYALTLRALPYIYPAAPAQTLELFANGVAVGKFELKTNWEEYSLMLPARVLHPGLNEITLSFAHLARPRDVQPPQYAIGKTGANSPLDIEVKAGALASIKVNGRETARQTRGYNIVALDPKSGALIESRAFDTVDDRVGSRALTAFIEKIPDGLIVVVAAQGDAAINLGDRAANAFKLLGGALDPRAQPSNSYALIGVKGAAPGAAIEAFEERAAFAWVGRNPDERTLAAAVSMITIEKK